MYILEKINGWFIHWIFPKWHCNNITVSKKMHIITLMDVDEDWYWYLSKKNEAKQMPSKVASHVTLVDLHKCGYMLLSTFNHLLILRSFNNEWKKLVGNTWMVNISTRQWNKFMGISKHIHNAMFSGKFENFLKTFTNTNLSNLGDLHIIDLETLCEKFYSL